VTAEKLVERKEFAARDDFAGEFEGFVGFLTGTENALDVMGAEGQEAFVAFAKSYLKKVEVKFEPAEAELFERTFDLYCLQHGIEPFSLIPESVDFVKGKGNTELMVEMAGPIASGKSTIANILAHDINAHTEQERFTPEENPFLAKSYDNPDFMLRTQIKFFLDNVAVGLRGKYHEGRWARDTSVWSDIYVFMEWRKRKGIVNQSEYDTYMKMVEMLEPLIEKPDLLVMVLPDSLEHIRQGLNERIEAAPEERKMEKNITDEDLQIVMDAAEAAVEKIRGKDIKVSVLRDVNPVDLYATSELQYATVYGIRGELGILREYLLKDPKEAAIEVNRYLTPAGPSQVVVVHSESMFAGKTSTLTQVAELVGKDNVLAYQPAAALRYGEVHKTHMMDRDDGRLPATTIESNRLSDIMDCIDREKITPREKPVIFVDEVMLFHQSTKGEALETLDTLLQKGFHVVVDGIDWQFNNKPFTFIQDLLARSAEDPNWHQVQLGTRCKYCEKPAHGSRRFKQDGSGIAHRDDVAYQAGDHYEPVCCEKHASCVGHETGFVRGSLSIGSEW
jgi:thymidine kinase/deoxyadenosine/deoxycytidine kinase